MRGIILADGTGSRLGVLTQNTNKHVLPVYDRPMICWAIDVLQSNKITDITIVSSPQGVYQIQQSRVPIPAENLSFSVQTRPNGIVGALQAARRVDYDQEQMAVILGDNVFLDHVDIHHVSPMKARCYLKRIDDIERLKSFGVPDLFGFGKIAKIVEKPKVPPSGFAVTGFYVFTHYVWEAMRMMEMSNRGELEITDLLNRYASTGLLDHEEVTGFWGDAGTPDGLLECANACQQHVKGAS
jgi:glucose-1-phosphate thymidylyltransferase